MTGGPIETMPDGRNPASQGPEGRGPEAELADQRGSRPRSPVRTVNLRNVTMWLALGTGLSRFTGVLRVLALAYALGATHLADGYNLANTSPNMLYDVVLGGVLSATFIPVFVDRLTSRSEREAWRAISAVVTLSAVVLLAATVIFWFAAPVVIAAFTALDHAHGATSQLTLVHERAVATTLLRWFVPQVAAYGFISLATALLNTQRRFIAPMWTPIANNVVCIAVLLWFHAVVAGTGQHASLAGVSLHPNQLVLLGLGTTLGVVVQALLLLPSLGRAHLRRLRWHWEPRHEAVRRIAHLGAWTFGFVVANQVALFVVLALAAGSSGPDPVSSYTYAYTFFQMPYAVVAVSVMSAVAPELAERWTTRDAEGFRQRLATGLRAVMAIIIPASVGMLVLAKPAVALLLGHGGYSVQNASDTGAALALFAIGLPGFCVFLYVVRVLQSMQRARVAFWLYLVENGINVVLAVALVGPMGVRGLALSLSVAYSVAAVLGVVVLRRWLGPLGNAQLWAPLRRVGLATAIMAVAVLIVSNLSGATQGVGLLVRVLSALIVGGGVYVLAAAYLTRRQGPPGGRRAGRGPGSRPDSVRWLASTSGSSSRQAPGPGRSSNPGRSPDPRRHPGDDPSPVEQSTVTGAPPAVGRPQPPPFRLVPAPDHPQAPSTETAKPDRRPHVGFRHRRH